MKVGSLFSGYGGLDLAVGGDLAWYSEIEAAASTVLAAHHPGVQNLGDITTVDWAKVAAIDVLTGGYPCQPFSMAGQRKGEKDERHLWPFVAAAIRHLRPGLVILENVRGHLTLGFDAVLADLASMGLSARWGIVRASDAGAPHQRARLFVVAYPSGGQWSRPESGDLRTAERTAESRERVSVTADTKSSTGRTGEYESATVGKQRGCEFVWGAFDPAIRRWERVIGRAAPAPTVRRNARDRINPVFVEWMMGLPEGWVTDHGLSASEELKMLGNGVVPQQARLALQLLGVER